MTALRNYILNDPDLLALSQTGNDAAIAASLNAVSQAILITRESIPADYLRALAIASAGAAVATGDATKIARWQGAVTASSGFIEPILLADPVLVAQLAQATTDGVLSLELKAYYTKRAGSVAERDLGGAVTVNEVSAALAIDRPGGIVGGV